MNLDELEMLNNDQGDAYKIIGEIKNSQMLKPGGITITLVINGDKFQQQLIDIIDCFFLPLTISVDFYFSTTNGTGEERWVILRSSVNNNSYSVKYNFQVSTLVTTTPNS